MDGQQPPSEHASTRDSRDDVGLFGPPSTDGADMLPGFEAMGSRGPARAGEPGPLEASVMRTLRALHAEGSISERDCGRVTLAMELAAIIGNKRTTGKTSTVGQDARVLMDILDSLAPAAGAEGDAALRAAMDQWTAEVKAREAEERERAQAVPGASPA